MPKKSQKNNKNLKTALKGLSRAEKLELAKTVQDLQARVGDKGPQTDDELHQWLIDNFGIHMPRKAVTEGHSTPFWLIADIYFGRTASAFGLANRAGSKTYAVALIHILNGLYKKDYDSITIGAIMAQSNRAYEHYQKLARKFPKSIVTSTITKTRFVLGGILEIVAGTISAVNGPHTQLVHIDEVELMPSVIFDESRQISVSKTLEDGTYYPPVDVITSTRKRPGGPVQKILDKIEDAVSRGEDPPYKLYKWNCFDVAQNVSNCRIANPDLPEEEKCQCHRVASGKWEDGSTRYFDKICGGKLARSEGWITLDNLHNTFKTSTKNIWEAQQECSKPSREGLVYPTFNKELHGIRNYLPKAEFGPIYQGIDLGGTNPFYAGWIQVLNCEVEVLRYDNKSIILKEGTRVLFQEIYKAEISNTEFAAEIVAVEEYYKREVDPDFRVVDRFADPAGKSARLELKRYKPPLVTHFYFTREVEEQIKEVTKLIENDLLFVDIGECPMFIEEIEVYPYEEKDPDDKDKPVKPVKDFDHAMDGSRYGIANIAMIELKNKRFKNSSPGAVSRGVTGMLRKTQPKASDMGTEPWRQKMGSPLMKNWKR